MGPMLKITSTHSARSKNNYPRVQGFALLPRILLISVVIHIDNKTIITKLSLLDGL